MSRDEAGFDKTMMMAPPASEQPPPIAVLSCIGTPPSGAPAKISLTDTELTFGRGDNHDVVLKIEGVSRNHARIYPGDGAWGLEDLGSTNGVYVNKSKIDRVWLTPGDIITVGKVHFKFTLDSAKASRPLDVDISDTEKTMIIYPSGKGPGAAASPNQANSAPPVHTTPAAAGPPAVKASSIESPLRPPAPASAVSTEDALASRASAGSGKAASNAGSSSSAGLWLIVALVAAAIVAGAYFVIT